METIAFIKDEASLAAHYGTPGAASTQKVARRITPEYRAYIEAAPFFALATVGPEGLDCSPRGDVAPAVAIQDEGTLLIPDRKGNNRIDSLRNIVRDPRVALMLMVPGAPTIVRINARAGVSADESLRARFCREGALPRTVIVVEISEIYFQCARALMRAGLWDGLPPRTDLPTPGEILDAQTQSAIDGAAYDAAWPARAARSMW
ncbi:MAG: pyridoxamine 5'-phosphate oxidase family protein [Pseudomonadota bacterium]